MLFSNIIILTVAAGLCVRHQQPNTSDLFFFCNKSVGLYRIVHDLKPTVHLYTDTYNKINQIKNFLFKCHRKRMNKLEYVGSVHSS